MKTKAVNLTEEEIECVVAFHGRNLNNNSAVRTDKSDIIERINYLHKRLKTFKEPETETKSTNIAAGWGTNETK